MYTPCGHAAKGGAFNLRRNFSKICFYTSVFGFSVAVEWKDKNLVVDVIKKSKKKRREMTRVLLLLKGTSTATGAQVSRTIIITYVILIMVFSFPGGGEAEVIECRLMNI